MNRLCSLLFAVSRCRLISFTCSFTSSSATSIPTSMLTLFFVPQSWIVAINVSYSALYLSSSASLIIPSSNAWVTVDRATLACIAYASISVIALLILAECLSVISFVFSRIYSSPPNSPLISLFILRINVAYSVILSLIPLAILSNWLLPNISVCVIFL